MSNGFTIVFRRRHQRGELSSKAGRSWLDSLKSERVFPDRSALGVRSEPDQRGDLYVVSSGDERQTRELLEKLDSDPAVGLCYVAPIRGVLQVTSHASAGSWHLQVKLAEAKRLPQWQGNHRVSVAVVDSGVDRAHPQLSHVGALDYSTTLARHPDPSGHGSHVAGQIAATHNDSNGFEGLAADCADVVVHRGIFDPHDVVAYYRALRAALSSARVINLSLGGEHEDPTESELIQEAIANGVIVVAAIGNSGELGSPTIYPAACANVIAVGAVDTTGQRAEISNEGDCILLAAPGVDVVSTVPTYPVPEVEVVGTPPLGPMSGTSMAAPIVTAVITRMLAYNPSLTRPQVVDYIEQSLGNAWNPETGYGVLDAHALLAAL